MQLADASCRAKAMRRLASILAPAALLAGCAMQPQAPGYDRAGGPQPPGYDSAAEAPPPPPGHAVVYIVRPSAAFAGLRDVYLLIGGTRVAELGSSNYTWMHVPAGEYVLGQEWPWGMTNMKALQVEAQLEAGKTYYYKFEISRDGAYVRWRLGQIGVDAAQPLIRQTRYRAAYAGVEKMQLKTSSDMKLQDLRGLLQP